MAAQQHRARTNVDASGFKDVVIAQHSIYNLACATAKYATVDGRSRKVVLDCTDTHLTTPLFPLHSILAYIREGKASEKKNEKGLT